MKAALVTGGGTGIGKACAADLVAEGWGVAICGRRGDVLEATAAEIGATPIVADMSLAGDPERTIEQTFAKFGRLDGVVLSGAASRAGSFTALTHEDWEVSMATNVTGSADLIRAALPHLEVTKGSIVAIASLAALRASSFMSAYSASKAGMALLIQAVAVQYGKKGVRANAVCPGWVRTDMADRSMGVLMTERNLTLDEAYEVAAACVPLRRPALPEEIAPLVSFLLGERSSYINGAVIPIDGGASVVDVGALVYEE